MRYFPPDGPNGWHHGLPWLFGGLIPLVLFAALIGVAIWAVVRRSHRPQAGSRMPIHDAITGRGDLALDTLRARYARGEISREEFLQTSSDLGAPTQPLRPEPPPPSEPA